MRRMLVARDVCADSGIDSLDTRVHRRIGCAAVGLAFAHSAERATRRTRALSVTSFVEKWVDDQGEHTRGRSASPNRPDRARHDNYKAGPGRPRNARANQATASAIMTV